MILKYRKVCDMDEGWCILQCLACYKEWEGHADWQFCPCCGTRITKHGCREHTMPRWRYEHDPMWKLQFPRRSIPCWAIQMQTLLDNRVVNDWHTIQLLRPVKSARQALAILNSIRQEIDDRYQVRDEYRLTRV